MTITRFIVSHVDTDRDGQCDGKPVIDTIVHNEEEARSYIRNAIEEYIDDHTDDNGQCEFISDFEKMQVRTEDFEDYTEWQFERRDIELTVEEVETISNGRFEAGYNNGFLDGQHSVMET